MKSIEIVVSGKVQKVGFRSCIKRIASRLNIKGEVMNLPDGTVHIRATGDSIILEKFVSMVYGCPRAVIRDVSIREQELLEYEEFVIRRMHI
jgi:acylphosphatase